MSAIENFRRNKALTLQLILDAQSDVFSRWENESIVQEKDRVRQAIRWFEEFVWYGKELQPFFQNESGQHTMNVGKIAISLTIIGGRILLNLEREKQQVMLITSDNEKQFGVMGLGDISASADDAVDMIYSLGNNIIAQGNKFVFNPNWPSG